MGVQTVQKQVKTKAEAKQRIAELQLEIAKINEYVTSYGKTSRPNYKAEIAQKKTQIAEIKAKMASLPK